jgi:hypothetical protein
MQRMFTIDLKESLKLDVRETELHKDVVSSQFNL